MRPEFQHLIDRLDTKVRQRTEDLAKGSAKDFAEYKHTVGIITGLKAAAQEIEEYGRAYDEDD
jgi:hypothetical protein